MKNNLLEVLKSRVVLLRYRMFIYCTYQFRALGYMVKNEVFESVFEQLNAVLLNKLCLNKKSLFKEKKKNNDKDIKIIIYFNIMGIFS